MSKKEIFGWERYLNDERTAEVVLIIDGKELQRVQADLFRKDLLDNKIHSKGTCAFLFNNFNGSLLEEGSAVRVRVSDDIHDLKNSPFIYQSPGKVSAEK